MPKFLYEYQCILGVLGAGTPEDPGTDFHMAVWIEADDETEALEWGHVLLRSYNKSRNQFTGSIATGTASDGSITHDERVLEFANTEQYPKCRVGEIPTWNAPWRHSNG